MTDVTEVHHYINRFGKHMTAVFLDERSFVCLASELYALGMMEADFNLPSIPRTVLILRDVVYIGRRIYEYEVHDEYYIEIEARFFHE